MKRATPETIQLWGGAVCLDFANSVDRDDDDRFLAPETTDVFADTDWVARWARRVGLIGGDAPPVTAPELVRIRGLREALYRAFAAIARGDAPADRDLATITATYADALTRAGLGPEAGAWRPSWPSSEPSLVLFAVTADAMRLLGDPERLARVTRCPGRHCGWLFINASGRRRWCSMSACGSREKMRRLHRRRRAAGAT